jgi:hypothetical protein
MPPLNLRAPGSASQSQAHGEPEYVSVMAAWPTMT